MEIQEALKIIRALADGVHPATGQTLPAESVYQYPQTVRALHRATAALEYVQEREKERSRLPVNAGKPWSRAEDAKVCEELRRGINYHEIAKAHNRTVGSIIARLVRLGQVGPAPAPSPPKAA